MLQRQKKLRLYIFLFVLLGFFAKPPSIIPGLCFPFCHFSIILSVSVGLLSLGCFLFSCFPIFHYLHFFLFECFYNRTRRMWKPSYNMTHKLQCHNCSYSVSPPGVCRSRAGQRVRGGGLKERREGFRHRGEKGHRVMMFLAQEFGMMAFHIP